MQNFDPMSLLLSDALTAAFSWANDLIDQVVGNSRKVESKIQKHRNKHCKENSRKRSACHLIAIASRIGGDPLAISFPPAAKKKASMVRNKIIFLLIFCPPPFNLHHIPPIHSFPPFCGSWRPHSKIFAIP